MNKDVEKFEELINESSLFDISKNKDPKKYDRERSKLIEYLYSYLISQNEKENIEYGKEIVEVAIRCINSFDNTKGIFLHYFNKSWKEEKKHIYRDNEFDEKYRGLKFSDENKRIIKKYMMYASKYGDSIDKNSLYKLISNDFKMTIEETIEIAKMVEVQYANNDIEDDDGEKMNLIENISNYDNYGNRKTIISEEEKEILEDDQIGETLKKLASLYDDLQERQKPIVADMITCNLVDELKSFGDVLFNYSFINKGIVEKYNKNGEIPSQRDIAKKYGKNEASISRTMRQFKGKLEESIRH